MKTLLVLKNTEERIVSTQYFGSKKEALNQYYRYPHRRDWEIIYLKDRKKSGHRYELEYAKYDECGDLYSGYIICFSQKEALYLKTKISEVNSNYLFYINKLY